MRLLNIHLDQLMTFYFVATAQSFTAAAEILCVTQPAVTAQLRSLEETYGVKLVYVKKKRAHLTEEGEMLLPFAEGVYRSALRAEELLKARGGEKSLRIGVAPALSHYLSPAVALFSGLYPFIRVVVREGSSRLLLEGLRDFSHDLCFVGSADERPEEFCVHKLRHAERMMLVASPANPLASKDSVGWEDLEGCPLVLHGEGSVARRLILEEFGKRALRPNIAAEVDNAAYIKQLVEGRGAVALMFSPNVEEDVAHDRLRVLPWGGGEIQIGIDVVLRKGAKMAPACTAFLKVLRQQFGAAFDYDG